MKSKKDIKTKVVDHYKSGYEDKRLQSGNGQLEFARTCELLKRFLPKPPATIIDVGGGSGIYACWLAKLGYRVHLIDIVPVHIEMAKEHSQAQPDFPLADAVVVDAMDLPYEDSFADAVLMFGPLYHLIDRNDRLQALKEAKRILKPNGILIGAAISRFASTFDGLRSGFLKDPEFMEIVKQDLTDGQHRNKSDKPEYFMDTFFHHPEELRDEATGAGFVDCDILGIEGPSWIAPEFDEWWKDEKVKEMFLYIARTLESEPAMIASSAHLLVKAVKR